MYAKVIVDINVPSLDRLFDYIIPEEELNNIKIGMRVIVPFGHQQRLGYVIDLVETSSLATKSLIEVVDIIPSVDLEAFNYIKFLESKNRSTLIDILETILPSEIFFKYSQTITILNKDDISKNLLNLLDLNKDTLYNNKLKEYKNEINKLISTKSIKVNRVYEQRAKIKYINTVIYNEDHNYIRANKYEDLITYVIENPNLTKTQISDFGFSISSINTLIKNDVFKVEEIISSRDVNFIETNKIPLHTLNKEQDIAYKAIVKSLNSNDIFLLKGITGSGKTEVYMKTMKDVLSNDKTILYLVPEISLVAPLVQQLSSRFDVKVTHYNSSLSKGERLDSYLSIIGNETKILVGTRSSIFLPLNNLGLIIVDEEHDSSYLQEDKVQYNTLDILKIKSKLFNAPIILGSATPKVSTMYDAINGKYKLLELTKRATNQPLPKVTYIDMKEELNNGNTSIFSNTLDLEINNRLKNKEQTILLYNRKGYSSFSICRNCGHTPKCKNCDISLTYYKENNELRCRYCNYTEPSVNVCPVCNKETIRPIGMGIDQVFELTKKRYPKARIIKMDNESTRFKGSHEKIWLDFNNHEYDILVGTKMVSKGLDFANVTLVGILMADLELKAPTYLATEETYSLLTQMIGRSGRQKSGQAIIQAYDINNYAIKSASTNYETFYKEAIFQRQISKYEPFYQVSQILVKNNSYLSAYQDALKISKELTNMFEIVLGPKEPLIKFIQNEYRFVITIKDKKIIESDIFEIIDKYKDSSKIMYYNNPIII